MLLFWYFLLLNLIWNIKTLVKRFRPTLPIGLRVYEGSGREEKEEFLLKDPHCIVKTLSGAIQPCLHVVKSKQGFPNRPGGTQHAGVACHSALGAAE